MLFEIRPFKMKERPTALLFAPLIFSLPAKTARTAGNRFSFSGGLPCFRHKRCFVLGEKPKV